MIFRLLKYSTLLLSLYIFLYNPIFKILGFGLIKVLLLFSIIYLLYKKELIKSFIRFRIELIFTVLLIVYSLIVAGLNSGSVVSVPYTHLIWFLECFVIPVFLITCFKDIFDKYSWESIIVFIGFIASCITLFLVFNPEHNLYIRENVIIDTLDTVVTGDYSFRGFTIAESSSYSYGIVQGLILSLCIFSLKRNILFAIPIIPLFISIFFNARMGFSVIFFALILSFIYKKFNFKYILIITVFAFTIVYVMLETELFKENEYTIKWGMSFFTDTYSLLKGNETNSNYEILYQNMFQLPDNFSGLVFGEGNSLFGKKNGSDIGYVNILFIGGFIYLLLMLFFLFYLYARNYKFAEDKIYPVLFLITLLAVNIKGMAFFVPNGFYRLITMYYVITIYGYYKMTDFDLSKSKPEN